MMLGLASYTPGCAIKRLAWVVVLGFALLVFQGHTGWAADDDAQQAKSSFEVFKVEKDPQGQYVATYRLIAPAEGSEVKATGDKFSPFVGLMKYEEQTFQSRADTPELAKKGPFKCEKEVIITEIFRYSKGKWVF